MGLQPYDCSIWIWALLLQSQAEGSENQQEIQESSDLGYILRNVKQQVYIISYLVEGVALCKLIPSIIQIHLHEDENPVMLFLLFKL